jgi:hypothetical protein
MLQVEGEMIPATEPSENDEEKEVVPSPAEKTLSGRS